MDTPELQDWRFVVGLTALIEGANSARVQRIAAACRGLAKRVIASVYEQEQDAWGHQIIQTRSIHDTEGYLTWQH